MTTQNTYVISRLGTVTLSDPSSSEPTTHYDIPLYLGDGIGWAGLNAKAFSVKAIEFRLNPLYNTTDLENPERSFRIGIEPANIDGTINFKKLPIADRISAFNKLPYLETGVSTTGFHKLMRNEQAGVTEAFPVMKLNIRNKEVVSREPAPKNLSSKELLNTSDALYQVGVIHLMTTYESMQPFTSAEDNPGEIIQNSSAKALIEAVKTAKKEGRSQPKPVSGNLSFILDVTYHLDYIPADERSK